MGGEFTEVNGVPQQGLVRLALPAKVPNQLQGPMDIRPGTAPSISRGSHGRHGVVRWPTNWDRDDRVLSYEVLRDDAVIFTVLGGSTFWKRPVISRTDSGLSANTNYSYRIRVERPGREHRDQCGHDLPLPARGGRTPTPNRGRWGQLTSGDSTARPAPRPNRIWPARPT